MTLSCLITLSTSSLSNLEIEANKFYDRAHRLYDAALLISGVSFNLFFGHI